MIHQNSQTCSEFYVDILLIQLLSDKKKPSSPLLSGRGKQIQSESVLTWIIDKIYEPHDHKIDSTIDDINSNNITILQILVPHASSSIVLITQINNHPKNMNTNPKFPQILPAPEEEEEEVLLLVELPLAADEVLDVDEASDVAVDVSVEAAVLSVEVAVDVTSLVAVPFTPVTDASDEVGNLSLGNVIKLPLATSAVPVALAAVPLAAAVPLPAAVVVLTPVASVKLGCVSVGSKTLLPPAVFVSSPGAVVMDAAAEAVATGGMGVFRATVVVLAADVTVVSVVAESWAGWAVVRAKKKRRRELLGSCILRLRLWTLEGVE